MPLDPQIPLSAAQTPSFAQQAGQVFQLAGEVEKQQEYQQQKQDQQVIQEALKAGANFNTPDGLETAAEQLKGKVSPKTYQILTQAHQEAKANEIKMREQLAKLPEEVLKGETFQTQAITQQLDAGIAQYKQDVKEVGQQEADRRYMEYKKTIIPQLAQKQATPGQPLFSPQILEGYAKTTARQDETGIQTMKWKQDQLDNESKRRLQAAQAEVLRAGISTGTEEESISAGAQVAAGMPINQVVPGVGKSAVAKRQAARREGIKQIMAENPGMTLKEAGTELAARQIDYASQKTGQMQQSRTMGVSAANIAMASSEARKMINIVKDVSAKMDLTEFPSINAIENAVSKGVGGTEIVRLNAALNGLINTYARAINPRGTPTITDKEHTREVINNAMSRGQTLAALDIMDREMEASLESPAAAKEILQRVRVLGKKEKPKESKEVPRGADDIMSILKKHGVK